MLIVVAYLISALVSYLLGSLNAGIIISKLVAKKDIRSFGSGNAGATNVLRIFGLKPAIFTLIVDCLKSTLAVFLAMCFFKWLCPDINNIYGLCVASFFSVLGHIFPVYFGFKGGKGVMTFCGSLILIHPIYVAIGLSVFIITVTVTKYASLGSIISCISYLLLVAFVPLIKGNFTTATLIELAINTLTVLLIIFRHRSNIKRLINKTESKTDIKSKINK